MKVIINTHYCSVEEFDKLIEYLTKECWDFRVVEKEIEPKQVERRDTNGLHQSKST